MDVLQGGKPLTNGFVGCWESAATEADSRFFREEPTKDPAAHEAPQLSHVSIAAFASILSFRAWPRRFRIAADCSSPSNRASDNDQESWRGSCTLVEEDASIVCRCEGEGMLWRTH